MNSRTAFHLDQFQQFHQWLITQPGFEQSETLGEAQAKLRNKTQALVDGGFADDNHLYQGQLVIGDILLYHNHLAHHVNRDLLWYFGGDCLHYMPDDEIEKYQQLDEAWDEVSQTDGVSLDYQEVRARAFGLN